MLKHYVRLTNKAKKMALNIISKAGNLKNDENGAAMTEYLVIILLVIVVGGIFLGLMTGAFQDIFQMAVDKIKSTFFV